MKSKKSIFILYNTLHKKQMVKLTEWLRQNLPQYEIEMSTQFMFARKIKKTNPVGVITYNKNLYSKKNLDALINYCNKGGKLITLHHNISSMMLRRPEWLEFTGIEITKGKKVKYPWSVIEGGDLYMFNINPGHAITWENIEYTDQAPLYALEVNPNSTTLTYELDENQQEQIKPLEKQPAILFKESEYFINHIPLPDPNRELLFGLYFTDQKSGRKFFSANGGWITKKGKGTLIYLMPGHGKSDYNEMYCRIIKNCLIF